MIAPNDLYFEWLMSCIDPDGVTEGVNHVCDLLHDCEFHRRIGNDINRAADGTDLRKEFLENYEELEFDVEWINELLMKECSWLEMIVALARHLDYLYEGGVDGRVFELINNMQLGDIAQYSPRRSKLSQELDLQLVHDITNAIDQNQITQTGHGGLFPLRKKSHQNQKELEIWDQHAAYFRERLEGVLWISTNLE